MGEKSGLLGAGNGWMMAGLILGSGLTADAQVPKSVPWDGRSAAANVQLMVRNVNSFGWNLSTQELQQVPNRNVFVSPLSVSAVLQMAALGAEGETRDQVLSLVGWEGAQSEDLVEVARQVRETLDQAQEGRKGLGIPLPGRSQKKPSSVEWTMANGLWSGAIAFDSAFRKRCEDGFGAKVGKLDGRAINVWVSRVTRKRIPSIVEPGLSPTQQKLVLTNAVYFKGTWSKPFEAAMTTPRSFRRNGGSEIMVPMMEKRAIWNYAETDVGQAALLPYGDEERIGMVVVLPPKGMGVDRVAAALSRPGAWQRLMAGLEFQDGVIRMPKFRMEDDRSLGASLKALGMTRAFADDAEFLPMTAASPGGAGGSRSGPGMQVSEVLHKSFLEIDEKGTEAAAATAMVLRAVSAEIPPPPPPFQLYLDRPYLMALVERETGLILFSGIILNPPN